MRKLFFFYVFVISLFLSRRLSPPYSPLFFSFLVGAPLSRVGVFPPPPLFPFRSRRRSFSVAEEVRPWHFFSVGCMLFLLLAAWILFQLFCRLGR